MVRERLQHLFGVDPADARRLVANLSPREREVARLLVLGHDTEDIGQRLGISPHTVTVHRWHVRAKLAHGNTVDCVRLILLAELVGVLSAEGVSCG